MGERLFRVAMQREGLILPLRPCSEHVGSVIDANGAEVLVVDANGERPDAWAVNVAALVAAAINATGGCEPA